MTYNGFVFFDIDGTLVDSQGQVPADNKTAIAQLRANGFLPIVCTGRGRGEMGTVLEDAGIHSAILLNGMEILHEKQFLFEGRIAQNSILKLLQLAKENEHDLGFYSQGEMRVTALSLTVQRNFRYFHQDLPQVRPFIKISLVGCCSFLVRSLKKTPNIKQKSLNFTFSVTAPTR